MIRNLKVLGFVLGAALALCGIAASSALAGTQGELTSDGPVKLSGADITKAVFTFSATEKVECKGVYDAGKQNETEEYAAGKFRHKIVTLPLTTLTVGVTEYKECETERSGVKISSTVTMNGCDFLVHIGVTNGIGSQYAGNADIVCPAGKVVEIHGYSNAAHTSSICTYTVPPQIGFGGGFAVNVAGGKVTIGGTATGLVVTRHKTILCGNEHKEINTATFAIDAVLEGKNAEGGATEISLSD